MTVHDGRHHGICAYVIDICFLTRRSAGRAIQVPVSCEDRRASKFNLMHEAFYKYSHLVRPWLRDGWP